ncbi:calcium binding protein [Striga asiatica]|uniref:Calcium binding protein n=1 Tax=Striga asiatica TaxID=4170 RepID=A0A5A7RE63_STRAF|nr:calcium binding protein [Striga asiatica]
MEKLEGAQEIGSSCSRSFRLRSPSLNKVRLRRIFDLFDKNKDSILTIDELSHALAVLGLQTDVEPMVQPYIQSGKHGLTYQDFEALHSSLNRAFFPELELDDAAHNNNSESESDLCEAFKVFDEDGDGFISARELQAVLAKLGLLADPRVGSVELMISSVDQNHDGLVDLFEFKDMMRNLII